ncbi:MAG: GGDEF domain-containing protein [Hoeflea sp.]|uniref:GGDEF domain-containing protein n=1 Tax=Hoeflea sp. TaxID=1940281 RepID=UPI0032EEC34E
MFHAYLTYEWLGPAIFVSAGGGFLLLYLHDRAHLAALRLGMAYLCTLVGFLTIMLAEGDLRPPNQAAILFSLVAGKFFLVWGVTSLFGIPFPRRAFGLLAAVLAGLVAYVNLTDAPFMDRFLVVNGFAATVNLLCGLQVWRARTQRIDVIVAGLLFFQTFMLVNRIIFIHVSQTDFSTLSAFRRSEFAASMQTENAMFAIAIGLALYARYSVTLVTQLRRLAETDALTGLLNRRAFETRVEELRAISAPLPTGLIICDIDHFKSINDRHGHDAGDRALVAFARLLERETPETAICTRLGGEEFCILLAAVDDEAIRLQATHLRAAVERLRVATPDADLQLTASFGYCRLDHGGELSVAMAQADAAVYQAKKDGRNLVRSAMAPCAGEPSLQRA